MRESGKRWAHHVLSHSPPEVPDTVHLAGTAELVDCWALALAAQPLSQTPAVDVMQESYSSPLVSLELT
jgi:hypothetical protein